MESRRRGSIEESIRLDSEGNWYQGEFPILHDRTVQYLFKNIAVNANGKYILTGEDKPIFIRVDDVPYWITKIERTIVGYLITLTDGTIELLDPDTLWIGKKNALYALVKGGKSPGKFFRAPYYEIVKDLQQKGGKFFLNFAGRQHPIAKGPPDILKKSLNAQKKASAKQKSKTLSKKSGAKKKGKSHRTKKIRKATKKKRR